MLEVTVKVWGIMQSVLMKKKRLQWEGFAEKDGLKCGMKERMGDEKLIIISVAVRGMNDHIRFYSQMLCTAAIQHL